MQQYAGSSGKGHRCGAGRIRRPGMDRLGANGEGDGEMVAHATRFRYGLHALGVAARGSWARGKFPG